VKKGIFTPDCAASRTNVVKAAAAFSSSFSVSCNLHIIVTRFEYKEQELTTP